MIIDFQSKSKAVKKDQVGNKFYNLFLLKRVLGLDVPDAFCITSPEIDKKELITLINPQKRYAIRSSSNSEDMSDQSAAGMFKSYLNIKGSASVLQKIHDCFNSINSQEARAYLKSKNSDQSKAKVSVIVQEMVQPEKAGVLFTVNPVNGAQEIVVEYMHGLAENLMDGNFAPERVTFSNPDESRDSFLYEMVKIGIKIETYFNKPQDVEWAYLEGHFFVLQARPVTTNIVKKRNLSRVWTRANIGEILPRPMTPLSWDVFRKVLFSSYRLGYYGIHDWILTNIIHLIPREFPSIISPQKFNQIAYLNLDTVRVAFSFEPWVSERILNMGLGFNFNEGEISKSLKLTTKVVKTIKTVIFYIERLLPFLSMEGRARNVVMKKLSIMDCADFNTICNRVSLIFGWHIAVTARSFSYLGYLATKAYKKSRRDAIADLLLKQDTTDFVIELEKLQKIVRNSPGLKEKIVENGIKDLQNGQEFSTFAAHFNAFLNKFGHRSDNEFELSQKDWKEDPDQLKDALIREKHNLKKESAATAKENFKIVNSFKLREDLKNLLIAEYRKLRRHFLNLGEILVKEKKLKSHEDIFFLKLDELQEINDPEKKKVIISEIIDRKNQFLQYNNQNVPFSFTTDVQGNVIKSAEQTESALKGVGCSQGVAKGRTVHIFSLKESSKLKQGDIMVTSATDPGWTPLFAKVSGVITEIGGMLSHTATIAREFNIPMITGIHSIKKTIPEGKTIEMDGANGTIKIMENN